MKASIPQGTRDFPAQTLRKRSYIFTTIKTVFELYGFEPLETPAMENLDTLLGKYGDEGDNLIFKILNNGLHDPRKQPQAAKDFQDILQGKINKGITERALRYDLTIPFARYVAMNQGQLAFPYKRYQMQPVWRADRPQKGRYREFYQCDADVVGSYSLINDIELAEMYRDVFTRLNIRVAVNINSRRLLYALALLCGATGKITNITVAIDKLDKVGIEKVKEELGNNLDARQIDIVEQYLSITGSNEEKLKAARKIFSGIDEGEKGVEELEYILCGAKTEGRYPDAAMNIDFTLARGLNYYTGVIYEVTSKDVQIGSIGGGGRYDDLTGLFGIPGIPGVGISFGVDRIYDVMEELDLFPRDIYSGTKVLFFNMGGAESSFSFKYVQELRHGSISCELYHEPAKMDKQFKYATKKNIPFVVIIGSKEMAEHNCVVKNLSSGNQDTIPLAEVANYFKNVSGSQPGDLPVSAAR